MRSKLRIPLGLALVCGLTILVVGCGGDDGGSPPVSTETGTIRVEVAPTGLAAPWHLVGLAGMDEQDTGDREITGAAVGSYVLTWGALDGWDSASAAVETKQLNSGSTIVFSRSYGTTTGALTYIQPVAASVWRVGQSDVEIRWAGGNDIEQVTLSLYAQDVLVANIVSQIANDHEFLTWDVPTTLVPGDGYKVLITQGAVEYWSEVFRVGPAIEVMSPAAGTIWGLDTEVLITWGSTQTDDTAQIDLYRGDLLSTAIAAAAPNTGSFVWTVPASQDVAADYQVRLHVGSLDVVSETFAIGQHAVLLVGEPTSTTLWRLNQSDVTISWSGGDVGEPVDLFLDRFVSPVATIATATENDGSHTTWDVPETLTTGPGYQLRVVQGSLSATSAFFSLGAELLPLTVSLPTAATEWEPGQSNVPIAWSGGNPDLDVSLYLHHEDTAVATIVSNTANDGSHDSWDVPSAIASGTGYQVRVVQGTDDAMSDEFVIQAAPTPLAVVTPDAGTAWIRNQQNVLITWTGGDFAQDVEITLHKGDTQVATLAAATPNDLTFDTWDVPATQAEGVDYRVRVAQGGESVFSAYFTISATAALEVTQPAAAASWHQDQQDVTITWNGGDPAQPVSLYLYKNTLQVATIATDVPNNGSHTTWDVPGDQATGEDYRVQVFQGADEDFGEFFAITPPPLLVLQPTSSTVWRRGQQNVLITWSGGHPTQNVALSLLKAGSPYRAITNTAVGGEFSSWDVPTNYALGDDYQIQAVQGSLTTVSDEFSIKAPVLEFSLPTADTIWLPGQQDVSIWWSGGAFGAVLNLDLYNGPTLVESIVASYVNNFSSYNTWDVPASLPYGTSYRVRASQGDEVAFSDYFQIGQPPLEIIAPDAFTVAEAGQYVRVEWSGGDPDASVSLYLYKSGTQVVTLAGSTSNYGSRTCLLPLGLDPDDDYRVQVAQGLDYDYGEYFTVTAPVPRFAFSEPDTGTIWNPGQSNVRIAWTGGVTTEPVTLELKKGWSDSVMIAASTANDGEHLTWDVPSGLESGIDYRVKISQGDRIGYSTQFQVGLAVTSPNYYGWYFGQTTVTVAWTGGFAGQTVDIELYKSDVLVATIATATANDGTEPWSLPTTLEPGNDYNVRIRQGSILAQSGYFYIGDAK